MNKKVFGRKLSRGRPAREALFAGLIKSLALNGKIVTTKAKAKAIQGAVGKYLTSAKKATLSGRRKVLRELKNDVGTVKILFDKKFKGLKIINLPSRKGDNAQMARIELIEEIKEVKKEIKNENISTKGKRS
jgi:large subunit ribosomal protein L17